MSTIDKQRLLAERLNKKTHEKKITWEVDPLDDAVGFRLGDNIIEVAEGKNGDGQPLYTIIIRNRDGHTIDTFSDEDIGGQQPNLRPFDTYYRLMEDLRTTAYRQATGVDAALDSILDGLDD